MKANNLLNVWALLLAALTLGACFQGPSPSDASGTQSDVEAEAEAALPATTVKAAARTTGLEIPAYLTDRSEEIVSHAGFCLSYNSKLVLPNWVAWKLTPNRFKGREQRAENFQPDKSIRRGPIAYDSDYRGSGYSRGHMCPSADNKHSRAAMNDCFLLSNMCPQDKEFNANDWADLESICRHWANCYDSIFIVAGPVIEKGKRYQTIGRNKVTVPERFFKVVMRWNGQGDAQAIGFVYDNRDEHHNIPYYAVSVDEVERFTGINFYPQLPKNVERKAEASYDLSQWKGINERRKRR